MADVSISIAAQLKDLRQAFASIPEIGEKEARGLAKKFSAEMKALERAAKEASAEQRKMAQSMAREAKVAEGKQRDLRDAMEGVKNAAEGLGGSIGGAAGQIEKAIQSTVRLGGAIGPVGVAAVGATAGMTGLALGTVALIKGMDSLAEASDEAQRRLGELSGVEPAPSTAGVEEWKQSSLALEAALATLTVQVADALGPRLTDLADLLAGLAMAASDTIQWFTQLEQRFAGTIDAARKVAGVFGDIDRALKAIGSLGLSEWARSNLGAIADEGAAAATSVRELGEAFDAVTASQQSFIALQEEAILAMTGATNAEIAQYKALENIDAKAQELIDTKRALGELTEDEEAMILASAEAMKQQRIEQDQAAKAAGRGANASQKLAEAQRQQAADAAYVNEMLREEARFLEDVAKMNAEFEASLVATTEATVELGEAVQVLATEDFAALSEAIDGLGNTAEQVLRERIADSAETVGTALTDLVQANSQLQIEQLQRIADAQVAAADQADKAWARQHRDRINTLLEQGKLTDEQAKAQLARIDDEEERRLKANQKLKKDEERAAKKAFKAQQSAAIASVFIDVAKSTAALTPAFWMLGPGAPLAAAGVAGAMGGVQIAAIQSAPPPVFASGGRVGDRFGGDHVPIMATRNEGIVTEAGMSRIGGSAGLEAINRGMPMGGDVTVVLPDGAIARSTRRHMTSAAGRRMVAMQAGLPVGQGWVYGGR